MVLACASVCAHYWDHASSQTRIPAVDTSLVTEPSKVHGETVKHYCFATLTIIAAYVS